MIREVIVYSIIALFIGFSQSVGIGGGPIINICLMLGLGLQTKQSMSITYLFLMGGAFASICSNLREKNPQSGGPIMDYRLIMITLPMATTGSFFGTLLNHFISELIITVLFVILLSYLLYNSYKKYIEFKKKQQKTQHSKTQTIKKPVDQIQNEIQINPRLAELIAKQKKIFQVDKLLVIGQIFVYTTVLLLMRGGRQYQSIIYLQKCGFGSYVCLLIHFLFSFAYSASLSYSYIRQDKQKIQLGFQFQYQSDLMSLRKTKISMIVGFLAGMLGGALGLGGAIILVPVWLNNGIDGKVATSSSGPLIFFSATVSYLLGVFSNVYDSISIQIFYFVLAFIASYIIKSIINYYAERYKLKSIIFITLIIMMGLSLSALLPLQISKLINNAKEFVNLGQFC